MGDVVRIIRPDGTEGSFTNIGQPPALEMLQKVVGGYIEILPASDPDWVLVVNDEGAIRHLDPNPAATELAAPQLSMAGGVLRGTVVYMERTLIYDETD